MNAETIAIGGSIGAAVLGYLGTYANGKALGIRQARLARLDSQLRDLYGPLVAVLEPQGVLFELWRMRRLNLEKGWTGSGEPDREEWRHRMLTVLMPLNRRAAEITARNAHLIQDQEMPPELIALCAHIESYEPLAARWNKGEFDRWMPYVLFPRNVRDYATTTFSELKREQSSLLGRRWWDGLLLRRLYRAPIRTPKT